MSKWIIEAPNQQGVLRDDGYRIIEVDKTGQFRRVIAKLHRDITPETAEILASIVEIYLALNNVREFMASREELDDDVEPTHNDYLLDCIEEEIERMFDHIEKVRT